MAELYTKLARDVGAGNVEVQQAQKDLEFAADAAKSVGRVWATKTAERAVEAAKLAVAAQQLKMRRV